jgi:hypothetical protein
MKQAIAILAVFLSLNTAAQQTGFPVKNELPAYKPVKFELHKHFISHKQVHANGNSKETIPYSFDITETRTPVFKTLQDNLKDDRRIFLLQNRKNEWAEFSRGLFGAYTREQWFENKNDEQVRWMSKKINRKQ